MARTVRGPLKYGSIHLVQHSLADESTSHTAMVLTAGEIMIFDQSWYNRAGVEHVMGYCTKTQHEQFLEYCPQVERYIVNSGIRIIKYRLHGTPCHRTTSGGHDSTVSRIF